MAVILKPEMDKALNLYEKIKKQQYGSLYYKAAKNAYDTYIQSVAQKRKCTSGDVHAKVILERRKVRLGKK